MLLLLHPCPSARPGVASARRLRTRAAEGPHEGPLLGRRVDAAQERLAILGKLGPEEVNTGWVDPRPWTETHEIFLSGVLLVAVMVIGFTAIQSMRRTASNTEA